jgi:lipopolysaccharide export system protein LptC
MPDQPEIRTEVPPPRGRSRLFGGPSATPRELDEAHSRFVSRAKIALPTVAVAVLLIVVAWPMLERRNQPFIAPPDAGQLEMSDARYRGEDEKSRPFEVRAERATRSNSQSKLVDLVKPEAEMVLDGGSWITISAETGRYDRQSGQLTLQGRVTLYHDQGYEFTTDTAEIDTAAGTAWGNTRVTGQGPFGDVDAAGFRLANEGKTIVFTGRARLVLPNGGAPAGKG